MSKPVSDIPGLPTDLRVPREWKRSALYAALGLVVALLAQAQLTALGLASWRKALILATTAGLIVAAVRHRPGLALALTWLLLIEHVVIAVPFSIVDLVAVVVAFATARWGSLPVVWLSALSIPLVPGALILLASGILTNLLAVSGLLVPSKQVAGLVVDALLAMGLPGTTDTGMLVALGIVTLLALLLPWLGGMVGRNVASARRQRALRERAEAAAVLASDNAAQAREIADLRAAQALLAHDVHDVVGHSLTVVLAQAEAGQCLDDADEVRASLAHIADAARSALREVRTVLEPGSAPASPANAAGRAGLAPDLVDNVRRGGLDVAVEVDGTPRPLPPELAQVSRRVLQEFLTNALRHGDPTQPVSVTERWSADHWQVEVRNTRHGPTASVGSDALPHVRPDVHAPSSSVAVRVGTGLDGTRRRLEAVGGWLEIVEDPVLWTSSAWMPVRDHEREART